MKQALNLNAKFLLSRVDLPIQTARFRIGIENLLFIFCIGIGMNMTPRAESLLVYLHQQRTGNRNKTVGGTDQGRGG